MKLLKRMIFSLATVSLMASCANDVGTQNAQMRGAAGGVGLGAIIGKHAGGIGQGEAMIAGGLIGALLGEKEYREQYPSRRY